MTDVVHENFAQRKASGELICSPMTQVQYHCTGPEATEMSVLAWVHPDAEHTTFLGKIYWGTERELVTHYTQWYPQYIYNLVYYTCYSLPNFTQNELNILDTSVDAEIGSGISQLYVTLAESKKTINMIAKAITLLRRPLRDARRILDMSRRDMRTPEGRERLLNKAGDLWLEGRYGWRPLYYEIDGILKAITKGRPLRFTARNGDIAYSNSWDVNRWRDPSMPFFGHVGYKCHWNVTRKVRVGTTADYMLNEAFNDFFVAFGGTDVLGSAWEIVPYSFIVDWFLNIGDALQSLQAYALVNERIAWRTFSDRITVDHVLDDPFPMTVGNYWYTDRKGFVPYTEFAEIKTRVPRVNFLPSLGYRFNMNWLKVADAVFLLRKALGR
jgi:hypothetical protein